MGIEDRRAGTGTCPVPDLDNRHVWQRWTHKTVHTILLNRCKSCYDCAPTPPRGKEQTMSNVKALTAKDFEQEVLLSEDPVLIDFFATWCGPCRALAPTVDEIAEERAGKLRVLKCDIDQQPDLANRFGIMSVPTLVLIKEGRTVETMVGAQPKSRLLAAIDQYLK